MSQDVPNGGTRQTVRPDKVKSQRTLSVLQNPDDAEQGEEITGSDDTLVKVDSPDDDYDAQLEEMGIKGTEQRRTRETKQRKGGQGT